MAILFQWAEAGGNLPENTFRATQLKQSGLRQTSQTKKTKISAFSAGGRASPKFAAPAGRLRGARSCPNKNLFRAQTKKSPANPAPKRNYPAAATPARKKLSKTAAPTQRKKYRFIFAKSNPTPRRNRKSDRQDKIKKGRRAKRRICACSKSNFEGNCALLNRPLPRSARRLH